MASLAANAAQKPTAAAAGGGATADVPSDANAGCVGVQSTKAGKASACAGCPNQRLCASGKLRNQPPDPALAVVAEKMGAVRHKVLVLSGKGGVGKSTFAAQLAFALAHKGHRVGLLDIDICGPSVPLMLGLRGQQVHRSASGWSPVYVTSSAGGGMDGGDDDDDDDDDGVELGVMSVGFMLPNPDDAVIWRGPRKNGLIKQFLTDVDWGSEGLDYLVVDTPPGTSDEHISIVQYLKGLLAPGRDGAVVVTTPQEVSMMDVRKELSFCRKTKLGVIGVVENMRGLQLPLGHPALRFVRGGGGPEEEVDVTALIRARCPELFADGAGGGGGSGGGCLVSVDVFPPPSDDAGPRAMAERFGVPFLGSLPLDLAMQKACERGEPLSAAAAGGANAVERFSAASAPLAGIVNRIVAALNGGD